MAGKYKAKLLLGITDPLLLAGLLYLGSGVGIALVATGGRSPGLRRSEAPLPVRSTPPRRKRTGWRPIGPAGSPAARPRGSETESTGRS